jgi:hypothetical protein
MKNIIKIKALLVAFLMIFAGSCTKDFEKMNTDPNNPTDVPAINIFSNAIYNCFSRQRGDWTTHTYTWGQQWTKIQYVDEDRYLLRDMSGYFNNPYTGELMDLKLVMQKATADGNDELLAAAKVMDAWTYLYLADCFGDVPMSEALQGLEGGTFTPVYDTQEDVYMAIIAELEEANTLITSSSLNFGAGDLIYNGDPQQWKKLANSLKLIALNRCAGTPWSFTYNMVGGSVVTTTAGAAAYANADTKIAEMLASPATYPLMGSNDDDAKLVFPGGTYKNFIYNTLYTRTDQGVSQTMVDWLTARNDPRVHVYAQPVPESYTYGVDYSGLTYLGLQNGSREISATQTKLSLIGTKVAYDEKAPLYMVTYDQVSLTLAEYQLRKANDAAAQTAYENGIKASMARWGCVDLGTISPSAKIGTDVKVLGVSYPVDYAAYLAQANVVWGGTTGEKFQRIIEQKWAAIYGENLEAWIEARRTGFPERMFEYQLEATMYPNLGLPIRYPYSINEASYNHDNLQAAKDRQHVEKSDDQMFSTSGIVSQVWWNTRKNPIPKDADVDEQILK